MDLSALPIVDHHAHSLLRPDAIRTLVDFQRWFTESREPEVHAHHVPNTLFFRTAVRWLAELLSCEPTAEGVFTARTQQPSETWTRRLFTAANIETLLCDYGYQAQNAYSHAELQARLPCRVEPILRLETLAESLISQHESFEQMVAAYAATVSQARKDGYVALKSIIAYRSGLAVGQPAPAQAKAAFAVLKAAARQGEAIRLAQQPLCDYLLWLALAEASRQELPIQFHTGFGDSDADLRLANPLHLRPLIERTRCPIVLLHAGWPFYCETAHLAAIYGHVWIDLSLAIPFATTGIPAMLRAVLGMAPSSKIMFATDAFTMPEIFWLAARWGRWGLGQVLDEWVNDGFLSHPEALQVAENILGGNARQLYL